MKKLLKGVVELASLAAIAAGIYYLVKKWMDEKDEELEDDMDDLDFEDEDDSREYVTLDIEDEEDDDLEDEAVADSTEAADAE